MSDETTFRISVATVTSIGVAVLSLIITILLFWVGGLSAKVSVHSEDIASMKQCIVNVNSSMARIENDVKEIRHKMDMVSEKQRNHYKVSKDNNSALRGSQ